jgi:hypothetical protein
MTVIYNMSIDRADKPWIGDRRLTESESERAIAARPAHDDGQHMAMMAS